MRNAAMLVLVGAIFVAGPARADMVVDWPDLALRAEPSTVSSAPTEATFVVTNTGSAPEVVVEPHLVRMDDGIRIPLTISGYELDGVSHSRFDEVTLAPGASMRVHLVFSGVRDRGEASWDLAFSFRGMRSPTILTVHRG